MRKFILQYKRAPGDTLVLSALVRDLKHVYGSDIQIGINCSFPDIWRNNPYVTPGLSARMADVQVVSMSEGFYIRKSREGVRLHYITAFFRDFTDKTGVEIWPRLPHGDIHLDAYEKSNPIIRGNYWVIVPGGKIDATVKIWPTAFYQEVVNVGTAQHNWHFVQEGAAKPKHVHPPLVGPLSMVGRTTIRDLMVNIYHSQGVVCGITLPMHIAAALNKPCVVLGGGREEPWWEHYANQIPGQFGPNCAPVAVPHRFLNTFGALDCCATKGCWRQRVVKLRDGNAKYEKSLCRYPVIVPGEPIAKCMTMIEPQHVIQAVGSYAGDWAPSPAPVVVRSPSLQATNRDKPAVPQLLSPVPATSATTAEMTCCILMYGSSSVDFAIQQRCLDSILATTPPGVLDFRIGCNQIGQSTRDYLRERVPQAVLYEDRQSRRKYPAMREMFHDRRHPIATEWVLWFDDDTYAVDDKWYERLKHEQAKAAEDIGAIGIPLFSKIPPERLQWFREAPWFRNRPFRTKFGRPAPNGNCVFFPVGWFWAARYRAISACDIPCSRLNHNGGDVTIGEQLYQNGFRIAPFNNGKAHIFTPPKSRRGYSEQPPWSR